MVSKVLRIRYSGQGKDRCMPQVNIAIIIVTQQTQKLGQGILGSELDRETDFVSTPQPGGYLHRASGVAACAASTQ